MSQLPASSRPVPRPSPLPSVSDGTEFVEYFCERIQSGPLAPMGGIQPATHKCLSQLNAREQKIEAYRLLRIDQGITIGQHNGAQSSTGLAYTVSGIVQFINDFSGTRSGSAHAYEEVWLAAALSWVCPFNIYLFYVPRNTDTIPSPIEKPATKEMALVVALLLRHEELVEALLPSVDLDIAWRVAFLNISPVEAAARTAQCKNRNGRSSKGGSTHD
ncbi:hypothetical protein E8E12_002663 [Didymella heteroderae]|uniref:Uncharacterized protein n=1 Tax=Didymella heteroderae TaxID=1769908 RepID=A0A9P4WGW8_9PLEO|nr:hypothetical protein E8E12_002663 [Didymella heteroderae]